MDSRVVYGKALWICRGQMWGLGLVQDLSLATLVALDRKVT